MSLAEMPIGLALIACDTIIEDRRSGKKSLIGIFEQIGVKKLPFTLYSMSLLVSLTGGSSEHFCEVLCSNDSSSKPIFTVKGKLKFKHPTQVIDLVFKLSSLRFTTTGIYWIKVLVDEIPLMMRPLLVKEVTKTPPEEQSGKK